MDLFVDGEDGWVEGGGGACESVGTVRVGGRVVKEIVVDLFAEFEGEI